MRDLTRVVSHKLDEVKGLYVNDTILGLKQSEIDDWQKTLTDTTIKTEVQHILAIQQMIHTLVDFGTHIEIMEENNLTLSSYETLLLEKSNEAEEALFLLIPQKEKTA
jgi:DNA mismatch repair ATPase MutL